MTSLLLWMFALYLVVGIVFAIWLRHEADVATWRWALLYGAGWPLIAAGMAFLAWAFRDAGDLS